MQDFVTGGDYLANALYVALAMDFVLATQSSPSAWRRDGAAVLLAVALSSRPVYAVAGPLLAGMIYRDFGPARMVRFGLVVLAAGFLLNFPFFLYDPSRFPTHHLAQKTTALPAWLQANLVLPALGMLIACLGFFRRIDLAGAFGLMGLAIAAMICPPVLAGLIRSSAGDYALSTLGWTLPAAVFGGLWLVSRREIATAA